MKKIFAVVISLVLLSGIILVGCGPKKEATSQDAIKSAQAMATVKEKVEYLMVQAQAFYNSEDFQGTIDVGQYIVNYLDKESQAAKNLIMKAKEALADEAQKAVDKVRDSIRVVE